MTINSVVSLSADRMGALLDDTPIQIIIIICIYCIDILLYYEDGIR